tara:strand:- start:35 stop:1051 length:1017 start_codon:yes stop_codon:yes gene_type:complete
VKIFIISSENRDKFGISKVINQLGKRFKKSDKVEYSNNFINFILSKPDILHIHGCWKIRLFIFFLLAKVKGVKVIISPHGMIDQNSLNQKKLKKKLALFLYQKLIFKNSDLIIVNSRFEKKNFLKQITGIRKIKIISHGVEIDRNYFPKKNTEKNLKFVFFSKIHKSKNLLTLIKLWENSFFLKKFYLYILGEIDDEIYFSKINELIIRNKNIKYLGSLNKQIQKKLSKYDVFIHPSKSENFGLVIYEALSSGLFLILNKNLKKNDLKKNSFAMNINFNLRSLNNSIKKISQNKKRIKSLTYKKKSLEYVKNNFNWEIISNYYLKEYSNITKNNPFKI